MGNSRAWELPEGWEWRTIGGENGLCEVNPPRLKIERDLNEPTSFLPMEGVDEVKGVIKELQTRPFSEVKSGYTYFEENDVLFAKITPSMQNGKSAVAYGLIDNFGFGSTEFHVLRPKPHIEPKWIYLFIRQRSFREEAMKHFRGAVGQQRVPASFLIDYLVPLPYSGTPTRSLAEQRRIVARIEELFDRLDEACRLRAVANEEVEDLIPAVLAQIFEDNEPQDHWPKIADLCEIRGGLQKSPKRAPKNSPRPYLRVANVQRGKLILDDIAFFEVSNAELERYRLLPGDVMIIEGNGSPDLVGRTAIFRGEIKDCVHQNHVIRLRPNTSRILPDALSAYLTSPAGRRIIQKLSHTSSGLLNLSIGKIQSIPVPPLSIAKQRGIIEYLETTQAQVEELKRQQAESSAELERLGEAILSRAFRGEL